MHQLPLKKPDIRITALALQSLIFGYFLLLGLNTTSLHAQEAVYTASGSFTVPNGITKISVECWGGGGAGGSVTGKNTAAGGGAGGSYAQKTVTVTPNLSYTVTVGGTKTSSTSQYSDNKGNPSWFGSIYTVYAEGGDGGEHGNLGGNGGTNVIQTSIGDVVFNGGNGFRGIRNGSGGAGGGAGGPTGDGEDGIYANGGIGNSSNGNGADGIGETSSAGFAGYVYGGGGSGAKNENSNSDRLGGSGAAGRVIIKWPVITVNPNNIDFGYSSMGVPSNSQSYQLTGENLIPSNGNISISAPVGFEISFTQNSGYANTLTLPYTNKYISRTIYSRFKPTQSNINYSGNIVNSGGGADQKNVAVSGTSISLMSVSCNIIDACDGLNNGSISVIATGGTAPYEYKLDNNPYQNSNNFDNLYPGTYNITVKDALGNTNSTTALIKALTNTMPAINALITNTQCNANNGLIKITNIPTSLRFSKTESDYVDLGGSLLNNLSRFTIEGWIKIDKSQISGERTWGLFGQNDAIEFGIMNSTTLQLWSSGGGTLNVNMSLYPSDNGWHHVAGTGDGSKMTIYIDGTIAGSFPASVTNYGSSTYNTVMGGHVWDATGNYINGSMLKVSFRSVALTQQQILTLAQSKFTEYTGSEPGMIAGFNFFEGSGTTMNSVGSSSAITGNLINSPEWVEVFTYSWSKAGTPSYSANTKNISMLSVGNYTLDASFTGICPVSGTWTVASTGINQWTGSTSTDWNTLSNWTCGIPDLTIDANIPSGLTRYPVLSTGANGMCKNLVLGAGSSVIINDNTLKIAGLIQGSGLVTATNGTVEFAGSTAQSIPAGIFTTNTLKNLTVNNSAGVSLNGTLNITGILKAQTGNLTTNNFLTLASSVNGTALIDGSGSGQVTGTVKMQRFIPAAYGYKYFSSPFTNATVAQFADDVDLNASFATFYSYSENKVTTGWNAYTTQSNPLNPGNGYAANFGTKGGAWTVNTSGLVNNGTIGPFNLSNYNHPYTKGYNLIGNPYPSPIDWDAEGWGKTNIDNAIYFFDAGNTDQYLGTYSYYVNGVSSDGIANNIIASQQAFFVHVKDGTYPVNGSITFSNQIRTTSLNPVFHKKGQIAQDSFIRLSAKFEGANIKADYTVAYFTANATKQFNPDVDALKIKNTETGVPNLWIISEDNRETAVKATNSNVESRKLINLGVSSSTAGNLIITANDISNISEAYFIYLKDNYSGKIQDLRANPEYRFDIKNEVFTDRFTLILSTEKIEQQVLSSSSFNAFVRDGSVMIHLNLKEEQVTARITDISGRVLLEKQVYGEGDHKIGQLGNTGIYIVSLYTDMGIISRKIYL